MGPAALAAALAVLARLAGWQGVDAAAQAYRVATFRRSGFTLWDPQWFGGHWTLNYSVLYPALAATISPALTVVVSAALAALGFDRLARRGLGAGGPAASWIFAGGTVVQVAIGQLTFLSGEAAGLAALGLALRGAGSASRAGRWSLPGAGLLGLVSALLSPLAGAFVVLAAAAMFATFRRSGEGRWSAPVLLASGPILWLGLSGLLFPGQGPMPYPAVDWLWEMCVAGAVSVLALRRSPPLLYGALLWMGAATVALLLPSPLGGNIGRVEDIAALPLLVGLGWSRLPTASAVLAFPVFLSQWGPAWSAVASGPAQTSTAASFFRPLDSELQRLQGNQPAARVEVVPTHFHWEAAYVAPVMALARGWERQLDVADNPIFYRPGALTAASYRQWLLDAGVRYVALAAAPLDPAGQAEADLIRSRAVPGLSPIWSGAGWSLFQVTGADGIVSGPATLVAATGDRVVIAASPGEIVLRYRYSPDWTVARGTACISRAGSWLDVSVPDPEVVTLQLSLLGSGPGCRSISASASGR